jgi:prevent-host-death family protein
MNIPVSQAKAQLTELVRRAEAGEEVVLTRHDRPVVRLVPAGPQVVDRASRRAALERARGSARRLVVNDTSAARSQDFLYDENGMPG